MTAHFVLKIRTACTTCLLAAPIIALVSLIGSAQSPGDKADRRDWIQLFNGKSLDGWVPKITGYPLGENYADTFRVVNGALQASVRRVHDTSRANSAIFSTNVRSSPTTSSPPSTASSASRWPADPDWAIRNNGLMLHSQSPQSMWKDQDFPISVEVQLLGGLPNGKPRSTANMCSPGTQVFINETMVKGHCLNSKSQTYAGDQWVRVEVEVRGGERLIHKVEGQTVLEYEKPTIGGGEVNKFDPAVKVDGTLLTDGYIAIQGESHPTEFRKIEVLNLSGCMDSKSPKYKSYYVHQGEGACK